MATATISSLSSLLSTSKPIRHSKPLASSSASFSPKLWKNRREFLKGGGLSVMLAPLMIPSIFPPNLPPPCEAKEVEVGSFLPKSPSDSSFVLFKASPKDTPALRAGFGENTQINSMASGCGLN